MATKPTNNPTWAESAAAGRVASDAEINALRSEGFPTRFRPPSGILNKLEQEIYDWIDWLQGGAAEETLEGGVDATDAGESFYLSAKGKSYAPDQQSIGSLSGEITAVAVDAERFYLAYDLTAGLLRGYALASTDDITTGEELWSAAGLSGTDTYTKIVSNGTYVGAIFDTEWHIYNATTGALVYQGDHTAILRDVAITDDYMMVVGVADGSDVSMQVIDLSDGTAAAAPLSWGVSLDARCCCAVDSDLFFVAYEADGSSNQIAGVSISAAGEPAFEWKANVTRAIGAGAQCCSNGRVAFLHNGDTGAWLVAYSPADGSVVWEQSVTCALPGIACDVKDVWLALDDTGDLQARDGSTGGLVREFAYPGAISSTERPPIASNSHQTFRGIMDTGTLSALQTINSGLRARMWHRESIAPHFNQATPEVL